MSDEVLAAYLASAVAAMGPLDEVQAAQCAYQVQVGVRSTLTGAALLHRALPRAGLLGHVRRALEDEQPPAVGSKYQLFYESAAIRHSDDLVVAGDTLELTAAVVQRVTPEERQRCLQRLAMADTSEVGDMLHSFSEDACDDPRIAKMAVRRTPHAFEYVGRRCRNDVEVAFEAVELYPSALQHAGPVCRNDPALVSLALRRDARSFRFAGEHLREDREFVCEVARMYPFVLEYVGDACREAVERALEDELVVRAPGEPPPGAKPAVRGRSFGLSRGLVP